MPPGPALPPAPEEIATMEKWVAAGAPMGPACTNVDGGPIEAGPNPYNTPTICTSGTYWTKDNNLSMRPGEACQACHQKQGGPIYTVGGTVYPTAHEPPRCNGSPGNGNPPMTVVVTDKNKNVVTVPVNAVGNFGTRAVIVPPFYVTVKQGAKERPMIGPLTNGDCNSCHTEQGANAAPGRVIAP